MFIACIADARVWCCWRHIRRLMARNCWIVCQNFWILWKRWPATHHFRCSICRWKRIGVKRKNSAIHCTVRIRGPIRHWNSNSNSKSISNNKHIMSVVWIVVAWMLPRMAPHNWIITIRAITNRIATQLLNKCIATTIIVMRRSPIMRHYQIPPPTPSLLINHPTKQKQKQRRVLRRKWNFNIITQNKERRKMRIHKAEN